MIFSMLQNLNFKFILFADDTNMFYCNNDISELIRHTNAKLDRLNVWFSVNRVSLNIAKKITLFLKIPH